ncbi:transketolase [Hydrogenivirga caldilitoris]|uniref:Transketolase n=1 Tax=Hydrogenivirga caldilitoris TaxID=246264 RepID=A0A497XR94_9AQUI|nr:transketolase [Hydrogenivirga caldilitoris]RLJ71547.1 transketolase [Hydrogenivirga caldilitoris]
MEPEVSSQRGIDQLVINTIRFLSVDQVEKAKSGHPGMPLGASHIIYLIYDRFLKFNPKNPKWINRDRFVLSAGHASAMLYSTLFMFGYDITIEDLKNFRQLGSKTPGHPESWLTPGVEATTGPLGQGFANAVGMALAEKYLSSYFNREGFPVIDHYTYVLCSDGDLMEGISYEAAALAGHWKLDKLIVVWDNNHISIDGDTKLAWSENVLERFKALGWDVQHIEDGYNLDLIEEAIDRAKASDKPSFISVRTNIGYGSPLQDTAKVHGAPLGPEKVIETKRRFNWPEQEFYVPEEALNYTRRHIQLGKEIEEEWEELFSRYRKEYPDLARELLRAFNKEWSLEWFEKLGRFSESMATRQASGKVLNFVADYIPTMLGGSADLSESNNTLLFNYSDFEADFPTGRNIHYGVREHAMGAIVNGMAYHGGILPYCGTFLIFSDYMRPPIRIAAMSGLQTIYVFTHDSIGLGEDGPTHQPVEQLPSLRLIPNLWVIRPADANEVRVAWKVAIGRKDGPTAIVLTRQSLPTLDRSVYPSEEYLQKGAYVLSDCEGEPDLILIGTGSEVHVALGVKDILDKRGIKARVVNFPSMEIFELQSGDYKESVLPSSVRRRVVIEAARGMCWYKYVGSEGMIVSMESFGKSAPGKVLFEHFGFTPESVAEKIIGRWFS